MFCLKHLLVPIFCLQLSLFVASQSNTTENAQKALQLLQSQIESSNKIISTTIPNLWHSYLDNITNTILQQLNDDIKDLRNLTNYITPFALNSTNEECLSGLNIFLDITSYNVHAATSEQQVFTNLLSLANAELKNVQKKNSSLYLEFVNCQKTEQNCDGINEGIIAEVEGLVSLVTRIPNDLLVEIYVLAYNIDVNWELIQSILMIDYNKVIQNATVCLVSKIEEAEKEFFLNPTPRDDDILEDFLNLASVVDVAYVGAQTDLKSSIDNIKTRAESYNDNTTKNIRDAIFRANQTINSLLSVPQGLNITVNCSTPDLHSLLNSSLGRSLDEYRALIEVIDDRYNEGLQSIDTTSYELKSIIPQVQGCLKVNSSCEYVSEKIAQKMVEIPLTLQKMENVATLLMYQSIPQVWDSGSKIVRDILEELQGAIVGLKSCIRLSLY